MNGRNEGASWRRVLSESYRDVRELQRILNLSDDEITQLVAIQERFPLLVNSYYLSLINVEDPDDPIRRMCIPSTEELDLSGFEDTSGESSNTVLPGLQHKYPETALVLSTSQCAVYCRHCFRRRFVGLSNDETVNDIDEVVAYIDAHPEITNVLISGGDALMNGNETIRHYLDAFSRIDHVQTIRLGTRIPVVLPCRITEDDELISILAEASDRKQLYVVTQFNHPSEVTPESCAAVRTLLQAGVPVRNQAVLLNGVNDDPETLAQLMNSLVGIGVTPYYVFQCRPSIGVKNRFQIPLCQGCRIIEQARMNLNGLAKSFRFVMSHDLGKIELLGIPNGSPIWGREPSKLQPILLRFHQAIDRELLGRPFAANISPDACWISEAHLRIAYLGYNTPSR